MARPSALAGPQQSGAPHVFAPRATREGPHDNLDVGMGPTVVKMDHPRRTGTIIWPEDPETFEGSCWEEKQ